MLDSLASTPVPTKKDVLKAVFGGAERLREETGRKICVARPRVAGAVLWGCGRGKPGGYRPARQ